MENEPANKQQGEGLETFRAKIAELKTSEENDKVHKTVHLTGCNPNELGEEDKNLYEKVMLNNLTIKEFEKLRDSLLKPRNQSQNLFVEYLANILQRQKPQKG